MSAIVFVGPSLCGATPAVRPDVTLRPPAAQGDIYRACRLRPRIIGLVDGYFEGVPSVWHKEILWALAQGIAVYGGSSMGALRAAELDVYGMTGIGGIYEWYRGGVIEDDAEVALLHGPAETGYVPLSEPLVNVRASCAAALDAATIDKAAAEIIIAAAQSLNYKLRQWPGIFERAGATGLDPVTAKRLAAWLAEGRVDLKQQDALALLQAVAAGLGEPGERPPASFRFEWTDLWDQAMRQWDAEGSPLAAPDEGASAVIDELRLDADSYRSIRIQAVARAAVLARSDGHRGVVDRGDRLRQLGRLRKNLGLMRKTDLDDWVERNGLDAQTLEALLDREALLEEARQLPEALIEREILALLHLQDGFAGLAERARAKRRVLAATALSEAGLPHGVTIPVLLNWYFAERRKQPVPNSLDPVIEDLGLQSRTAFYRLLAAEYVYSTTERGG